MDEYQFIFDTQGGSEIETFLLDAASTTERCDNVVKSGYMFVGWYTDINLVTEFILDTHIMTHTIIYAKWEVIENLEIVECEIKI